MGIINDSSNQNRHYISNVILENDDENTKQVLSCKINYIKEDDKPKIIPLPYIIEDDKEENEVEYL